MLSSVVLYEAESFSDSNRMKKDSWDSLWKMISILFSLKIRYSEEIKEAKNGMSPSSSKVCVVFNCFFDG